MRETAALMQAGDYAQAVEAADTQLATRPDDVLLLRLQGICLTELGRYDQAVEVLAKASALDEDNVACRFYLAQAQAYNGNIAEAISNLNCVRELAPGSPYDERAGLAIPQLESLAASTQAAAKPSRWTLCLRLGGEYDDNVAARSSADDGGVVKDSWREVVSAYLELRPLDQAAGESPLTVGAYASGYKSRHEESVYRDYDLVVGSGAVFARHSGTLLLPYSFDLTACYTDATLGEDPYSRTIDGTLSFEIQWARWAVFAPYATWAERDFENDTTMPELYSRDGVEVACGADQYFYLFDNKVTLGVGYEYREVDADGELFDIKSRNGRVMLHLSLPLEFRFGVRASYSEEDYLDYTPDPKRVDDSWTINSTVSRSLFWNWLTAEVTYTRESSDSTLEFSDYERNVTGVSLRATF